MLFTSTDIATERNVTLTSDAMVILDTLIPAVTDWAAGVVGYPLETSVRTVYFDGGSCRLFLPTAAPVTALTLSSYASGVYSDVDPAFVRFSSTGAVACTTGLPCGFQAVRATFTSGWTDVTVPRDLREALIDLTLLKLQRINNFAAAATAGQNADEVAGPLKRITAGQYTEDYDNSASQAWLKAQLAHSLGDGAPADIMGVLLKYQRAWAI